MVNALAFIRKPVNDAQKLLDYVRKCHEHGRVEYSDFTLNESTGVLSSLIWSFRVSKEIVRRCDEKTVVFVVCAL